MHLAILKYVRLVQNRLPRSHHYKLAGKIRLRRSLILTGNSRQLLHLLAKSSDEEFSTRPVIK